MARNISYSVPVQSTQGMQFDMGQFFAGSALYIVISILIIALVFLVIRLFVLWYWRVNEIVSLLEQIKNNTSAPIPTKVEKEIKNTQI